MWALIAVVVVGGVALYEWLREPTAAEVLAAAQKVRDAARAAPLTPEQRKLAALTAGLPAAPPVAADRVKMCGLLAGDYNAADLWSRGYLGPALPVPERLKLMLSVTTYANWPIEARRVYCAYVQELAPTQFPHGHWGS